MHDKQGTLDAFNFSAVVEQGVFFRSGLAYFKSEPFNQRDGVRVAAFDNTAGNLPVIPAQLDRRGASQGASHHAQLLIQFAIIF